MHRELHAIFHGIVQGVCFRVTIHEHARALNLVGSVKNLDDGTVEVFLQGSEEELKTFLENVHTEPGSATIEHVHQQIQDPQKKYKKFSIIY